MKTRRSFLPGILLTGLLLTGLMLMTVGCNLAGGKEQIYDTTSIDISIGSPEQFSAKAALGTFIDVVRVTMEVAGDDKYGVYQDPLVPEQDLVLVGGEWTGTITGLPVDPVLTFTARGYDAGDVEIFSGVTTQVLTGVSDSVVVAMDLVSDGEPILFPRVLSIRLPAEIINNTDANVKVEVEGSADETLAYEFTSVPGGGVYAPNPGDIVLPSSGTGTFNVTYTAPEDADVYGQNVKVINSQGNSVEVDFNMTVKYSLTDLPVGVLFAPVVVSLNGKRTGDVVTWTAVVEDDIDPLNVSYQWGFTPDVGTTGLDFVGLGDTNPADFEVYDETKTGVIILRVTDGYGLTTTITFNLVLGQFPDDVIIYE